MRKLAIFFGGAALLAGCQPAPPPPPAPPVPDLSNALLAPGYVAQAASSDEFEIQSGQMAEQASQNAAVRNFANLIITDHTRSTQMVLGAVQSAGLSLPPPAMLPSQLALLEQLRSAGSGPAFDQAFQQVQIQAHQQALMLHQNYAAHGDVPALRAVAAQLVPIVQMHLQMAQQLNSAPPPPVPSARRPGERG